jgi:hypothetical protein
MQCARLTAPSSPEGGAAFGSRRMDRRLVEGSRKRGLSSTTGKGQRLGAAHPERDAPCRTRATAGKPRLQRTVLRTQARSRPRGIYFNSAAIRKRPSGEAVRSASAKRARQNR